MRLDAVEIAGFKWFCDRQNLSFQGGVTGIVGPNGCGKSNISDAISWVLGEQSAKSLRATGMEDVIFAGSQSRQPLGMAEVHLKVSGLNGNSPDGNPEATVTRRLYRNGDSEYLINGSVCRLRSPLAHRGGGRHHQVQSAAAADLAEARSRATESPARQRHHP
jgi:chromosome segregation protein